jgi:hypothetical protein
MYKKDDVTGRFRCGARLMHGLGGAQGLRTMRAASSNALRRTHLRLRVDLGAASVFAGLSARSAAASTSPTRPRCAPTWASQTATPSPCPSRASLCSRWSRACWSCTSGAAAA